MTKAPPSIGLSPPFSRAVVPWHCRPAVLPPSTPFCGIGVLPFCRTCKYCRAVVPWLCRSAVFCRIAAAVPLLVVGPRLDAVLHEEHVLRVLPHDRTWLYPASQESSRRPARCPAVVTRRRIAVVPHSRPCLIRSAEVHGGLVLWVIAKAMVVDGGARRREAGPTAQRRGTSHMCSESGASEPYPPPWVRVGAYSGYRIHLDMRDSQQHRAARPPSSTRTAEPLAVAGVCVPAAVVDGPPRRDARLHTAAWIHDPGGVSSWVEPRCRTTRGAGPARSAAPLRKAVSRKPGASRRTTRCTAAGCAWGCRARVTHCRSAVLPYCRCRAWPHRAGQPSRRTPDQPHSRRLSQARHTSRARSTRTAQHLE